ncbi:hypothetical protein IGB31_14380 [Pseudomonas putida]|nr:hypothetical protein IGB31_14380 [Pseudomonas putida]
MNEVTEMLNKEKCVKLENKVCFLNSKIDYLDRYISKTEMKIKNIDTDHRIITNVEIKEVKEQGFKDQVFILGILTIMAFMVSKIENGSILSFGLAVCVMFLSAAAAKLIAKKLYTLKLRRLNLDARKLFLTDIFNLRIKKCRRGIEICKREIGELKIQIDELKKEKQYSI